MTRMYQPVAGVSDWRRFLASPNKHWKRGGSAFEMAVAWESSRNAERRMPAAVAEVLDRTAPLANAELLMGIPEHRVVIPGGGHASQTDLWLLLKNEKGLISLAIEAKAGEPFDDRVSDWLRKAKPGSGKELRLDYLCKYLEMDRADAETCRYQLLHRTVAPIIEAKRFGAHAAVMLVQSWPARPGNQSASRIDSWADFQQFGKSLGVELEQGRLAYVRDYDGTPLYVGWLPCQPATDADVAAAAL